MKKMAVLFLGLGLFNLATLTVAHAAGVKTYNCGGLKFKGSLTMGSPNFKVQTSGNKVFLITTPLHPDAAPSKVQMTPSSGGGDMVTFSAGDLDVTLIPIHRAGAAVTTQVTLQRASNRDLSTRCLPMNSDSN